MSVSVDGQSYYRTAEVCRMVGISRNTLFRWIKEGIIIEPARRDWRGWRLFNQVQVDQLKAKTSQTIENREHAITTDFCGRYQGKQLPDLQVQINEK
jgi:predicted site-specific integrase-resolvase